MDKEEERKLLQWYNELPSDDENYRPDDSQSRSSERESEQWENFSEDDDDSIKDPNYEMSDTGSNSEENTENDVDMIEESGSLSNEVLGDNNDLDAPIEIVDENDITADRGKGQSEGIGDGKEWFGILKNNIDHQVISLMLDKSSCTYIHSEFHNCSLHLNGQHYDLKPLTLNNSNYEIKDVVNKSIIYLLNVCGPVTDSEAPCDKNSMIVMKDLDQNNVKYRIKSLGKMDTMTILNGDVIIKSFSGSYCDEEGYYSSVVRFICSVIEEKPQLLKKTGCTFHFQWKTPYACPKIDHSSEKKCIIQDVTNNISLDFTNMKNTFLKVNLNRTYVFDLCKENYTECLSEKNCSYFPVQKKLSRQNDRTCLEFNLPKKCESVTDINMVRFELICDIIINNGHFNLIGLDNCTLKLELHTNLICSKQDVAVDVYRKHENFKYDATNEQILKKEENCSITNNLTGYKFYISSLQLNIPSLHCPEVSFNNQNHSVLLTYSDNTICKLSDKKGKYDYRILLKCSKDEMEHQMHSECSQEYENPKFCKLFETSILDNLSAKESNTSATGSVEEYIMAAFMRRTVICNEA
ncbi:hypothetical protein NQ314_013398 [Rhamnusium bicolor]|uniref:MRH domain-containing protein n=1 Tax=Rhamnusium bicolor TaxID=1586634 RepID=A0AAV8X6E3_9CUCU|nr:hypothetical protein NQ314_013398 [Rhamnusium bicolor]